MVHEKTNMGMERTMVFFFLLTHCFSFIQPLCLDEERSALLQLKGSFIITKSASWHPLAQPKTSSWEENGTDCCDWEGVECHEQTGHVIALDLSSSFLTGSLNSNSSLFRLVHLEKINFSDNHFNFSHIPSEFGNLSRLTHLNLSSSMFSGQIPSRISVLSELSALDLSLNYDFALGRKLLQLKEPNFEWLIQNLTKLEELLLSHVDIDSTVPDSLANILSLRQIFLKNCGLKGEFPVKIFHLPYLQVLNVASNLELTGFVPELSSRSYLLSFLLLGGTSFSGEIPSSIGNLQSLKSLDLQSCKFTGLIPPSLGNLSQLTYLDLSENSFHGVIPFTLSNLTQLSVLSLYKNRLSGSIPSSFGNLLRLSHLDLSVNNIGSEIPPWIGRIKSLTHLSLSNMNLQGEIPVSFANLTQLSVLSLGNNQITGLIPSWIGNLTALTKLELLKNLLRGPIPSSISELTTLEHLNLFDNQLSGEVELSVFLNLERLSVLFLSYNNLSLLTKTQSNSNATLQQLKSLGLGSCNLTEFPDFLRNQNELEWLDLPHNRIVGQVPTWIWNISRDSMKYVVLSNNLLTGFENATRSLLGWPNLQILDLASNMLQGSLPIPTPSIRIYLASGNRLTGEIPSSICNLDSLYALDLSYNNLSGELPNCFSNLISNSLSVLKLRRNSFDDILLQSCGSNTSLQMIDLSENRFQGELPRSLATCSKLEHFDISNNKIKDIFPYWLASLPHLQVLILSSNEFHGVMSTPEGFSELRILDISRNRFNGDLPGKFFQSLNAMKIAEGKEFNYRKAENYAMYSGFTWFGGFDYSFKVTSKGMKRNYEKAPQSLVVIDFSSNNFLGKIPELIGTLKGLHLLDFSNNNLTGKIPSSLGNLTELEGLDLSRNKLSGEIPPQLTNLNFLGFFNVSDNLLSGNIPQGNQFDAFQNSSFDGNTGLCGAPLSKKCDGIEDLTPSSGFEEEDDENSLSGFFEFGWKIVVLGYGCGLLIGGVIGCVVVAKKHHWFEKNIKKIRRSKTEW